MATVQDCTQAALCIGGMPHMADACVGSVAARVGRRVGDTHTVVLYRAATTLQARRAQRSESTATGRLPITCEGDHGRAGCADGYRSGCSAAGARQPPP